MALIMYVSERKKKKKTLTWVENAAPNMTLISIDEYVKRDARPTEAVP